MKDEYEIRLAEEFTFMCRGNTPQELKEQNKMNQSPYSNFGCECSSGWFELIKNLCREITAVYQRHGEPVDLCVDQVKEKWGTLRFYYSYAGQPQTLHAFDGIGGGGIRFLPERNELQAEIAAIVRKYEEQSAYTCEWCGQPGSLRQGRYILTLCDGCDALRTNKNGKRDIL